MLVEDVHCQCPISEESVAKNTSNQKFIDLFFPALIFFIKVVPCPRPTSGQSYKLKNMSNCSKSSSPWKANIKVKNFPCRRPTIGQNVELNM